MPSRPIPRLFWSRRIGRSRSTSINGRNSRPQDEDTYSLITVNGMATSVVHAVLWSRNRVIVEVDSVSSHGQMSEAAAQNGGNSLSSCILPHPAS